jgi:ketosteroid isomerase-like protein
MTCCPWISSVLVFAAGFTKPAAAAGARGPLGPTGRVAVFEEMIAAVNAGDAARYARLYAVGATITIYGGAKLVGRDAIEKYEVDLLSSFPGTRFGIFSVWQAGDGAVAHYGVSTRPAGGKASGHEGVVFLRFDRSGRIEAEHRYLDTMTPMAQMGALGALVPRAIPVLPDHMTVYDAAAGPEEIDNVATVRRVLGVFLQGDAAPFLTGIAENIVIDDFAESRPSTGRPAAKAWFDRWRSGSQGTLDGEISTVLGVGRFVLVELTMSGALRAFPDGPLSALVPSTRAFTVHRAFVVDVKKGRIVHLVGFANGKELAESVGQWPPARK